MVDEPAAGATTEADIGNDGPIAVESRMVESVSARVLIAETAANLGADASRPVPAVAERDEADSQRPLPTVSIDPMADLRATFSAAIGEVGSAIQVAPPPAPVAVENQRGKPTDEQRLAELLARYQPPAGPAEDAEVVDAEQTSDARTADTASGDAATVDAETLGDAAIPVAAGDLEVATVDEDAFRDAPVEEMGVRQQDEVPAEGAPLVRAEPQIGLLELLGRFREEVAIPFAQRFGSDRSAVQQVGDQLPTVIDGEAEGDVSDSGPVDAASVPDAIASMAAPPAITELAEPQATVAVVMEAAEEPTAAVAADLGAVVGQPQGPGAGGLAALLARYQDLAAEARVQPVRRVEPRPAQPLRPPVDQAIPAAGQRAAAPVPMPEAAVTASDLVGEAPRGGSFVLTDEMLAPFYQTWRESGVSAVGQLPAAAVLAAGTDSELAAMTASDKRLLMTTPLPPRYRDAFIGAYSLQVSNIYRLNVRDSKLDTAVRIVTEGLADRGRPRDNMMEMPPAVADFVWQSLDRLGFSGGSVLDIGAGRGILHARKPETLPPTKVTMVEPNLFLHKVAKAAFPGQVCLNSEIQGTALPAGHYNLAITSLRSTEATWVRDPDFRSLRASGLPLEDYGLLRAAKGAAEGGAVVAFVPSVFLDSVDPTIRAAINRTCEFVAACRIPGANLMLSAQTSAPTDIVFFRKRAFGEVPDLDSEWLGTGELPSEGGVGALVNNYFLAHPERVMGTMMAGADGTLAVATSGERANPEILSHQEWQVRLAPMVAGLPENVLSSRADASLEQFVGAGSTEEHFRQLPEGAYCLAADGSLAVRQGDGMSRPDRRLTNRQQALIVAAIPVRDAYYDMVGAMLGGAPEDEKAQVRQRLNEAYDRFAAQHGHFHSDDCKRALSGDPTYPVLLALASYNAAEDQTTKSEIFERDTIAPPQAVTHTDDAREALALSLGRFGRVDMPFMAGITGRSGADLLEELSDKLFVDPESGQFLISELYLSGNVVRKLADARRAAELYPEQFSRNVTALEAKQPLALPAEAISVRLGAAWIPPEVIRQFVIEKMEASLGTRRGRAVPMEDFRVNYQQETAQWHLEYPEGRLTFPADVQADYGTARLPPQALLELALNQKTPEVSDPIEGSEPRRYLLNVAETTLAESRQRHMMTEFGRWIWEDANRREMLLARYRDTANCWVEPEYDHSWLQTPGLNPTRPFRPNQMSAVARGLLHGNLLVAQGTGAGKSGIMAGIAVESRRMGLCNKSAIVVPSHMLYQAAGELINFYPTARILMIGTDQLSSPERRATFLAQCANSNWDAVLMTHDAYESIPMSPQAELRYLTRERVKFQVALEDLRVDGQSRALKAMIAQVKRLDKLVENAEAVVANAPAGALYWEQLGVDQLLIDEAHRYKRLDIATKMNVAGIQSQGSNRSMATLMKCEYTRDLHAQRRGVVMCTATPITNTMTEMWTMSRYVSPQAYAAAGIHHFDAWAANFGRSKTQLEQSPDGSSWVRKERFCSFDNLQEAIAGFRSFADIKTKADLNLPTPRVVRHNIVAQLSPLQEQYKRVLAIRAYALREGSVGVRQDNVLKVLGDFNRSMLDMRVLTPDAPEHDGGRVALCANKVAEIYQRTAATLGTQVVFCDTSTPKVGRWNAYHALRDRLVAQGIPVEQIAFMHDAKTNAQREELFENVRRGRIRVVVASTEKGGTGTNFQDRMCAVHHLDAPQRPTDLEQREGRAERPGNISDQVDIFTYTTEGHTREYELLQRKAAFISQALARPDIAARSLAEEIDPKWAETMALTTNNTLFRDKFEIDQQVNELNVTIAAERGDRARMAGVFSERANAHVDLTRRIAPMTQLASDIVNAKDSEIKTRQREWQRRRIEALIKDLREKIARDVQKEHEKALAGHQKLVEKRPGDVEKFNKEMAKYEKAVAHAQAGGYEPPAPPEALAELPEVPTLPDPSKWPKPSLEAIKTEIRASRENRNRRAAETWQMEIDGRLCDGREEAKQGLVDLVHRFRTNSDIREFGDYRWRPFGTYLGQPLQFRRTFGSTNAFTIEMQRDRSLEVEIDVRDPDLAVDRIRGMFGRACRRVETVQEELNVIARERDAARERMHLPIPEEARLAGALERQSEINAAVAAMGAGNIGDDDEIRELAPLAALPLYRGTVENPDAIVPLFDAVCLSARQARVLTAALNDRGLVVAGGQRENEQRQRRRDRHAAGDGVPDLAA